MTEEEKKEFEEFLQWKAEKAKKMESENQLSETTEEQTNGKEHTSPSATSEVRSNIPEPTEENTGNSALIVIVVFVGIFFLVILVVGLSGNKRTPSALAEIEDSVALAVIDNKLISKPVVDDKQDSIAKVERISAVKKTIKITSAYLGRPNSASGVDAYFYYKNLSDKTIKYLIWEGYPMNAVGDRVSCEIRGYRDYRGKDTGPVKPGKTSGGCWDCAWYNSTAKKLILTGIEIEYMDGSTFTIKENEMEYVR
ncbi:MAG: hypothetical protein IK120_09635 [Muribaculaceae bacterium]|nr:hypothetical protein [Muribaculaceae bacterium]